MTTQKKHSDAVEFVYLNLAFCFANHAKDPSKNKRLDKDWYVENIIIERLGIDVLNEMQKWSGSVWQQAWDKFDKQFGLA